MEARISAHIHKGQAVDAERVTLTVMGAVVAVRKAIAVVTPALLPGAVLGIPTVGAMLLPIAALFALLCALLLRRAPYFRVLRVLALLLLRALRLLTPILLLGTLGLLLAALRLLRALWLLCPLLLLSALGLLLAAL